MKNTVSAKQLSVPEECTLFMTDRCNFKCSCCSRSVLGVKNFKDMKLEVVQRLLSLYPSIKSFCVAGLGEPTLCPDFVEILDYLAANGKYIGIITNGTDVSKILALGFEPNYISISLYGYNGESYQRHTGVDAFQRVMNNYDKLRYRFNNVGFSYILHRGNYKELETILFTCDRIKPDFLHLHNYLAYDYMDHENTKKILSVSDSEIKDYINKICKGRNYVKMKPTYLDTKDDQFACSSYNYLINLDGDGNIGGCQRQIPPDPSYGNIFKDEDPFNTSVMCEFRSKVQSNCYPHEECCFCFGRMRKSNSDLNLAAMILFHEKVEQTIECVQSILPSNINIYILNNNSSTSAREQLGNFCTGFERVKIFDSDVNLGVGNGRNYLISHTLEEWLFFIDNDITVKTHDWLFKIVSHINEHPNIDVFIPKLFNIHENSYVNYSNLAIEGNKIEHGAPVVDNLLNIFPGGASFVNRNLFERLGLYDEKIFIELEDFEYSIRGIIKRDPIKAMLINDIELVHDHRKVHTVQDQKAVLNRYNMDNAEKSFNRIKEKYKDLTYIHEARPWIAKQIDSILPKENIDLTLTTPAKNYGSMAGSRTISFICKESAKRKNVYIESLNIAKGVYAQRLIEFGCGEVSELIEVFKDSGIEVIGVDSHLQFKIVGEKIPLCSWITCDITDYSELEWLFSQLKTNSPQVFLLSRIECLDDPRPILRTLKRLLLLNPDNRLIISTPDRAKNHGEDFFDMPVNASHTREWSLSELLRFIKSSGFAVRDFKHINPDSTDNFIADSFLVLSLTKEEYDIFLHANYLPSSDIEYLFLTQEYSKAKLTGGIGTYIEEMKKVIPENLAGICLLGKDDMRPEHFIVKQDKLIIPEYFFEKQYFDSLPEKEITLQIVEQIIYFYPDLRLIEYQDIWAIGLYLAHARSAGFLPPTIVTKVCCHGPRIYIENSDSRWMFDWNIPVLHEEERISVISSDIICFPTNFLYKLCLSAGYELDSSRVIKERLPYTFKDNAINESIYEKIDTLILFGKRISHKGFTEFTEAIRILLKDEAFFSSIKEIILLGPKFGHMEQENLFFDSLKSRLKITELSLKRDEAIYQISSLSSRALCILPYRNDNHPYSVLETINIGCQMLATNAGGIPELIPHEFHSLVLCEPSGQGIADAIRKALSLRIEERRSLIKGLYETAQKEQILINNQYSENLKRFSGINFNVNSTRHEKGSVTIIVSCCRTRLDYIKDLVYGLNQQSTWPEKVIFIVDKTDDKYSEELKSLLSEELKIPFDLIKHSTPLSPASARNIGLYHTNTDYIINLEPYDIPKINFVKSLTNYLDKNPGVAAVTSYYASFDDNDDWQNQKNTQNICKPLGDFSMILGQTNNLFGHSDSAYRTDILKKIDGWDESGKSDCIDWALFLKIRSNGWKIGVVPKPILLYRSHPERIEETKIGYPEQRILALNTHAISRFDAFRLQSVMRHYQSIQDENRSLKQECMKLNESIQSVMSHYQSIQDENRFLKQECIKLRQRKAIIIEKEIKKYPPLFKLFTFLYKYLSRAYKLLFRPLIVRVNK